LNTSPGISNNTDSVYLTTATYPPGIWLFTYQCTTYFSTGPSSFLLYITYLSGPATGVITQYGKCINAASQVMTGSNTIIMQCASVCLTLTASASIQLRGLVNAMRQLKQAVLIHVVCNQLI
jgi:hypothetical protein